MTSLIARRNSWQVLLLDFSRDQYIQSASLARQLDLLAPDLSLVAVGSSDEDQARAVLAAMRAGVSDFIAGDASVEEATATLVRACAAASRSVRHPPLVPVSPRDARLVLLVGARAGLGVSTMAVHLASLAAASAAPEPEDALSLLLLDLGFPAGDGALYLGTRSDFHFTDALQNPSRLDATLVRTALSRHASGTALLGHPSDGATPGPLPDTGIEPLLERLETLFGTILCDLGGLPLEGIPSKLLQRADETWIVTDQSIGALVSLDALLTRLGREGLRDHRLQLVVSRFDEEGCIDAPQIAERFGLPLAAVLPERLRTLRASASQGVLLQHEHRRDPYLRALVPLLQRLGHGSSEPLPPTSRWRSLASLAGLSRWKTK